MKTLISLSLLLLLLPGIALAQNDNPLIDSITPDSGPTSGGTHVTIRGRNLSIALVCILPCPTDVFFDGVKGTLQSENDREIVVVTPPHAAGPVDVTLRVADGRTVTVPNGFRYGTDAESAYETVLLPVYLDGRVSGANGSQWQTDLWIRNDGTKPVALAPWECPPGHACPAVVPLTRTLGAGESIQNLPAFFRPPTANTGRLLYIWRDGAENVSLQLRFADVSRGALNGGTEMPVVREKDLRTKTVTLQNVPFAGPFRVLVRVFDVDHGAAQFRLNVYAQQAGSGNEVLYTTTLTATTPQTGDFHYEPAYAQFDLSTLLQRPAVWPQAFRIEVEPLTPNSRFWAFASITNNDTQLVTLVSPQ